MHGVWMWVCLFWVHWRAAWWYAKLLSVSRCSVTVKCFFESLKKKKKADYTRCSLSCLHRGKKWLPGQNTSEMSATFSVDSNHNTQIYCRHWVKPASMNSVHNVKLHWCLMKIIQRREVHGFTLIATWILDRVIAPCSSAKIPIGGGVADQQVSNTSLHTACDGWPVPWDRGHQTCEQSLHVSHSWGVRASKQSQQQKRINELLTSEPMNNYFYLSNSALNFSINIKLEFLLWADLFTTTLCPAVGRCSKSL